jgi:hypothetical protein
MKSRVKVYMMPDEFGLRGRIDRIEQEPEPLWYRVTVLFGYLVYIAVAAGLCYVAYEGAMRALDFARYLR